ncbi:MAG: hypothetical protein IKM73_06045, partial [Acidaminococcaceae bacterium]|nr:hypothetical protein [Acidaminococcaceae bacterium]
SQEAALEILKGLRAKYEQHHGLHITDEALKAAVELSSRYINDRFLPEQSHRFDGRSCQPCGVRGRRAFRRAYEP